MVAACTVLAAGCATTAVTVTPSSQPPVCDSAASALVLWTPHWRPNQKDVPEREAAAVTGLKKFLQISKCFASSALRRLPNMTPSVIVVEVASGNGQSTRWSALPFVNSDQ